MSAGKASREIKDIQNEATAALYLAAIDAANFVKAVLATEETTNIEDINFQEEKRINLASSENVKRLEAALKLLEITFSRSS